MFLFRFNWQSALIQCTLSSKLESEKPWLHQKDPWERLSWWITFLLLWIGVGAGAVVCYFAWV